MVAEDDFIDDETTTPAKRGSGKSRGVTFAKVRASNDFELNYDRQEDRETVNSIMNAAFKNHKANYTNILRSSGERSRINTNNKVKSKAHHIGGSRPFVWHRKKLEKMVEIQSQSTTESEAPKDVDIFTQVLGTRSGYVRGLGHSVKPIAASSSTLSIQRDPEIVHELEATKATIKELKARQSEYDILKN
ncbi:hypothetical protein CJ030_MR7G000045 [Morella rubra]|uniref:Uncharacterized protein n=1 Tax=Morella rubra TaxID=262757 RepID=A0A6A1V1F0_9ROSI|nr:hypothetical protein CJ030_MR7G000045 [Morella rubra]